MCWKWRKNRGNRNKALHNEQFLPAYSQIIHKFYVTPLTKPDAECIIQTANGDMRFWYSFLRKCCCVQVESKLPPLQGTSLALLYRYT